MATPDILAEHLQALDAPQQRYAQLRAYHEGRSPLAFLSPSAKEALKDFDRISVNVVAASILAVQERIRVVGFQGADVYPLWLDLNLDQRIPRVITDALLYGAGYVGVWADSRGNPRATIESPLTTVVVRDPVTDEILSACKRIRTKTTTEAWLYEHDTIRHFRADNAGAMIAGFELVEQLDNPLGTPPVAVIGHEADRSYVADLVDGGIQDGINKVYLDGLIASEAASRPRRWVTGLEVDERPVLDDAGQLVIGDDGEPLMEPMNPFTETENKIMLAEPDTARIGQLAATDLAAFRSATRTMLAAVEIVTGIPAHYWGQLSEAAQPTSADSQRASEAALVSRVEAKHLAYGPGLERVGQLLVAVRDGVNPEDVRVRVRFAPADTRSEAQEADAVTKLHAEGVISTAGALRRMGYTEDEIEAERVAIRAEALDRLGVGLSAPRVSEAPETTAA
ncbi:phage portal protein [Mycolicibacterium sphagni]|uniref:Phage portal protein n=1 Tax=Mycolicibacterium sphagni TaxID=1786 RepID=A0A255DKU0_9MYCO|nr:phage portal protein [Mycolicibacterium sphagni]OYN79986.1 hypothetical protein CG716_11045 [Mycolicibacterium sphagni]